MTLRQLARRKLVYHWPSFQDLRNNIEYSIGLLGTQKAFSCEPSLAIITVSAKAWKQIEKVAYTGYDALLPFKDFQKVTQISVRNQRSNLSSWWSIVVRRCLGPQKYEYLH